MVNAICARSLVIMPKSAISLINLSSTIKLKINLKDH